MDPINYFNISGAKVNTVLLHIHYKCNHVVLCLYFFKEPASGSRQYHRIPNLSQTLTPIIRNSQFVSPQRMTFVTHS